MLFECPSFLFQAQAAFSANPANPAILSEASAPISQDGSKFMLWVHSLRSQMLLSLLLLKWRTEDVYFFF
jgi:hypothetical protein